MHRPAAAMAPLLLAKCWRRIRIFSRNPHVITTRVNSRAGDAHRFFLSGAATGCDRLTPSRMTSAKSGSLVQTQGVAVYLCRELGKTNGWRIVLQQHGVLVYSSHNHSTQATYMAQSQKKHFVFVFDSECIAFFIQP
jgi:hypothetical protein